MTTEPRVDPLVALQTRAGNEVVNHLVGSSGRSGARSASALRGPTGLTAQPSMTVGAADDIYEREADRIAETVLRRLSDHEPGPETSVDPSSAEPQVQRVTRLDDGCRYGGGELDAGEEQAIRSAGASGRPLENDVRAEMERGFGVDFGAVRIHADARADTLNRSLASDAFTSGRDIFFRSGNYAPRVRPGTALLAHELAHTIQQGAVGGSGPIRRSSSAGPPDVQAGIFSRIFGTKTPKKKTPRPPGKGEGYPQLEKLVERAQYGTATRPELEKALEKIDSERARASKAADNEDRLNTLRYFEDEIGLALDRMRVADTQQQAKQIDVDDELKARKQALAAALQAPDNELFAKWRDKAKEKWSKAAPDAEPPSDNELLSAWKAIATGFSKEGGGIDRAMAAERGKAHGRGGAFSATPSAAVAAPMGRIGQIAGSFSSWDDTRIVMGTPEFQTVLDDAGEMADCFAGHFVKDLEGLPKDAKVAFWSGAGAAKAAQDNCEVALEKSALARSFDDNPISSWKGGTEVVLWAALSNRYATEVARQWDKFKVHGFIGPGVRDLTIFDRIESKAIVKVLGEEHWSKALKQITWHGVKVKDREPDYTVTDGEMKGCFVKGTKTHVERAVMGLRDM